MRRIPRLTARFLKRRQALGATVGPAAFAVSATVGALTREPLPGPGDYEALIPPVVRAWCRRVTGFNLWLLYVFDDAEIEVYTLTANPPVPIDD